MEVITTKETTMLALNTAENGTREHEPWDLGRRKQSMSTYYKGDHDDAWSTIANASASELDDSAPYASESEMDDHDDAWSITVNAPESDLDDDAPNDAYKSGIDDHDDAWSITANASETDLDDTAWWSEDSYHELLHSFSNTGLYPSPNYDPFEEVFTW